MKTKQTLILHPNFLYLKDNFLKDFNIGNIKFDKFNDGWDNIYINNIENDIENQDIIYIGDYSKPEYIFTNYALIRSLIGYNAKSINIIVPFFPVGTMERISIKGEVATSKYFADILSYIPNCLDKKTKIHIFDIHSLEQKFFFDDFKINVELHSCMSLIKNNLKKSTIIVFPDEGAKKRFAKDFENFETIFCSKVRDGNNRNITIHTTKDIKNKECIIIDDMIQSGGTLIETSIKLKELGVKKVSCFATHGVFVNDSINKLKNNFDTIYTTNTIPKNINNEKIKILDFSNLLISILK